MAVQDPMKFGYRQACTTDQHEVGLYARGDISMEQAIGQADAKT